ncbi:MAG TPA: Crp/Fnr family transcriptional regulator [Flavisolibacter sp.]|jgi:CRP-like cAMP-binding protein|nr:Crp/Fnr family transcriptional regulator [Flavisolibacter sp.]
MWDLLLHNFSKKGVELNLEEIEIVQSLFRPRTYRKHQYIVQQGEVVRYESFIIDGLAKKYEVDDKGQEHILLFMQEDWWAGDLYSFYTGNPSPYNVDCLEETTVLQITRADLYKLYIRVPKMNIYFRILYQNAIVAYNKRVSSNLSKTALERYHEFLDRYPHLEQKIPNHQIASFLGITPQSLSRIRGQAISKKG